MKNFIFSFVLTILLYSTMFSQGVIYTRVEADKLYGPVLKSVEIQSVLLKKFFNLTNEKLMFRITEESLIILNNHRDQLYPGNYTVFPSDVFRVFGIDKIDELINNGKYGYTVIELRQGEVISLTNGEYTLEYATYCPPFCD